MPRDTTIGREVNAVLRLDGGLADEGLLDIYDAADTIYGLARATNIVTHAFLNKDQVKSRANSVQGAHTYIHSSLKGCFEEKFEIHFENYAIEKIGPSVLANNFWDYLTWSWSAAIGKPIEPESASLRRIVERDPELAFVIADALETPMQKLHRAIARDTTVVVTLNRPKVGDKVILNHNSLAFVSTRDVEAKTEYISGNVTKFNVLSDFGRMFSDIEEKTVSFRLAHADERLRSLCLKSMQEMVEGAQGKMNFLVSKVVSGQEIVKRYLVHDILPQH
jgi:hypothetical protein